MDAHFETIKCPQCETIQNARVEHSFPFWSYVHECNHCKYIITESNWDVIKKKYIMKEKNKDIIEENIETDKNIKQYNKAKEIKKKQIKEYFDNRKPK